MTDVSFASLNPALLARKGGAKPAMRPQIAPLTNSGVAAASNLEDLGWNDMGDEAEPEVPSSDSGQVLHLTPEPSNASAEAETRALDKAAQKALSEDAPGEVPNEIKRQQAELAERVSAPVKTVAELAPAPQPKAVAAPKRAPKRRSALERGKRAAFTLRLDEERHLKLRLLSTVKGRSAQQIVTEALDAMLDGMDEIDSLAAQVQRG